MKYSDYEAANGSITDVEYGPRPPLDSQLITTLMWSVVAIIVLIPNIMCIAAILSRADTRHACVNWHIVSLCVATSMAILIRAPPLKPMYENTLCTLFTIIYGWLTTALTSAVLALNLDRFIWLFRTQWYFLHEKTVTIVLISLSWFFPLVVFLKLVLAVGDYSAYRYCFVPVSRQSYVAFICFIFPIPAFLILCVAVAVIWRYNTGNTPHNERLCEPYESPWRSGDSKQFIIALIVVDVLFIAMWLPVYILELLMSYYAMHINITLLGFVNLMVTPCIWCIHPGIRQSFRRMCCCRQHMDIPEATEHPKEMTPCVPLM